ncbi:glutathione S-transferase family protein [Pseudenhygromyxa sp. WMMC2535]|uniref:glutathione S-transferase family protein n=1 Tax=Pseudenhygromyxa sp. WMMC2535 TaxID=2712867 RepID=UPI001551F8E9|nr:glutathione S-transferase family protein [Pseudenhygromyxa sp. WMMC2535]NVB39150.1 glutathione S-transferase family protein [Pseudenhygromyxa sp. WMMC2535]
MKLYQHPASQNARKIAALIAHTGLEVEFEFVDLTKGEQQKPEFLALNPNGKIPVLVDGDFTLWESNAIMAYLADKSGDTTLWPEGQARYDVMRWLTWDTAHWSPTVNTFVFENMFKVYLGGGEPSAARLGQATKDLGRHGKVLDDQLAARPFVTGDDLTIADLVLAAPLGYAVPAKVPLEDFANIRAWMGRIAELPAWQKTEPKLG